MVPVKVHQLRLAGSSTNSEQKFQIRNAWCERDCVVRCWLAAFRLHQVAESVVRRRAIAPRCRVSTLQGRTGPEHVMLRVVVLMRGKMEPTHAEDRTPRTATD
jgi:hypothetical protein